MKVSLKNFKRIHLLVVIGISLAVARSVFQGQYIIPIGIMMGSAVVLYFLKKRVSEVIYDERDLIIAGKASVYAIQAYSWIAVIMMFVFFYYKDQYPVCGIIAFTLAFSICGLSFIHSFISLYLSEKNPLVRKGILTTTLMLLLLGLFTLGINPQNPAHISSTKDRDNMKTFSGTIEKVLNTKCSVESDCETPGEYLIKSNCPYTSKCIKHQCNVICPQH